MAEIVMQTNKPDKAVEVLKEVLKMEASRLRYSLNLAKRRLKKFEKRYNISSERFIREWSAEDLQDKDLEYVEWAGEYRLFLAMNDRLLVLKGIKNVTPERTLACLIYSTGSMR